MRDESNVVSTIRDLAWLHHLTELNTRDTALGNKGGQIDYFIDTPVLHFALDASMKFRGRSPVGLFDHDRDDDEDMALAPAAFEVVEYIFSRNLPGQKVQLLLSQSHGVEFERTIAAKLRDESDGPKDDVDDLLKEYRHSLEISAGDGLTKDEIVALAREASELVRKMFDGSLSQLAAIQRLSGRWREARSIPAYAEAAAKRSKTEVRAWMIRLACAHADLRFRSVAEDEHHLAEQTPRQLQWLKTDAEAVLDLIAANKAGTTCVLITNSPGLHRAYRDWYLDTRLPAADRRFYVLRHPLQYIPMINLWAYTETFNLTSTKPDVSPLFDDVRAALDAFLDPQAGQPRFDTVLNILRTVEAPAHQHFDQDVTKLIQQLEWRDTELAAAEFVENWRLAYANAALMVLPALNFRYEAQRQTLRDAITRAGGDHLLAQQTILANIELEYSSLALWTLGQNTLLERGRLPPELQDQDVVRVDMPILIPLEDAKEGEAILQALGGTVSEAADLVRKFVFQQEDAAQVSAPRFLAGVCLSLALGEWDVAKKLSERWTNPGRKGPLLSSDPARQAELINEFRYLHGLSIRFDCVSADEFRLATAELSPTESPADAPHYSIHLRNARALVERGTLRIAAALRRISTVEFGDSMMWPQFEADAGISDEAQLLDWAAEDLVSARARLSLAQHGADARRRLTRQASVNTLCCYNLRELSGLDVAPIREAAAAAYEFLREIGDDPGLKWISALNIEAYETLMGICPAFPGPRSEKYYRLYGDLSALDEFSIVRRFVAGSDRDLLRLYKSRLAGWNARR